MHGNRHRVQVDHTFYTRCIWLFTHRICIVFRCRCGSMDMCRIIFEGSAFATCMCWCCSWVARAIQSQWSYIVRHAVKLALVPSMLVSGWLWHHCSARRVRGGLAVYWTGHRTEILQLNMLKLKMQNTSKTCSDKDTSDLLYGGLLSEA